MILADGMIGQIMEPVELPPMRDLKDIPEKPWATSGHYGKERRILNSLIIKPEELEPHVNELQRTYDEIYANERKAECYKTEDAEIVLTAYGHHRPHLQERGRRATHAGRQGRLYPPDHPLSLPRRRVREMRGGVRRRRSSPSNSPWGRWSRM